MKLKEFYFRHKKIFAAMSVVATVILLMLPQLAFAADDPEISELMNGINEVINTILRFVSALLWPVLMLIGSLMDNDLIFGGAMGERLREVWVQMRNFVNIIFVIVLLAVALYNVLGVGEDGGPLALKTVLPKFVLALIAVNFSFFAIRVVLDFTNVITGAVFSLPATVSDQRFSSDQIEKDICETNSNEMPMKRLWCKENKFNDRAKSFFAKFDRTNVAMIYAIKFGKAHTLKFIKGGLKGIGQLAFNVLFNTVLFVVYALSFIALFLVLLGRVVALWIAVVLSPLLALSIVVPQLKELAGGAGELQTKFVKNAIAPITIGLVLSVGYIMLEGFGGDKTIHGDILSSSTLEAIDPNALPTDITDLQQLMVAIGVIVIVWTGVFDVAKDTVAGTITESIRSNAVGFGKFMAKLPTYGQVIPVGGKKMSLQGLWKSAIQLPQMAESEWGRSYWDKKPNEEIIREMKAAGTNKKLAEAVNKDFSVLKTRDAWNVLEGRRGFEQGPDGWSSVEEFRKKYTDPNDRDQVRKLADTLMRNGDFKDGVGGGITEGRQLAEKIISGQPTSSTTKITNGPTYVSAVFKNESIPTDIKVDRKVKDADEQIRGSGLKADVIGLLLTGDGRETTQIAFKPNTGTTDIAIAKDLNTALSVSNITTQQITDAVKKAKTLDKAIREKILSDNGIDLTKPNDEKVKAALKGLE